VTSRVSLFSLASSFFSDVELVSFIDDAANVHSLSRDAATASALRTSTEQLLLRSSSESERDTLATVESVSACRTCGCAQFASPAAHRLHCASDWHRLNLKLRLAGVGALSEADFKRLQQSSKLDDDDDDDDSDDADGAGGDSSSGSDGDATDDLVADLTAAATLDELQDDAAAGPAKTRTTSVAFVTADGKRIDVSKSLLRFAAADALEVSVARFRSLRAEPLRVAVLLMSGGRFAGGLFVDQQCTHHKAVSRYVVRAKQGGSQAFHDSKGRAAKSVGASLRRQNFVRLQEDIAETLRDWRGELKRCQLILLSAPGDNRRLFVKSANAPKNDDSVLFARNDARIRTIAPLVVQRPTFSEVQRVHFNICSLEIDDMSAAPASAESPAPALASRAAAVAAAAKASAPRSHPLLAAVRAASVEQIRALFAGEAATVEPYLMSATAAERVRWEREALETPPLYVAQLQLRKDAASAGVFNELVALCQLGRIPIDAPIGASRFRTPLHVAMQSGDLGQTLALLNAGADPSRRDSRRQLPIDLAARAIVEPLRRFAFEHPDLCVWADAGIVPLTPELERAEAAQRGEAAEARAKAAAEAALKAEALAVQQEAEAAAQAVALETRDRALKERRAIVKRVRAHMSAISDREKRALAAERRIKGTPNCTRCSTPLPVVSFDWEGMQFCTERCFVAAHQEATRVFESASTDDAPTPVPKRDAPHGAQQTKQRNKK